MVHPYRCDECGTVGCADTMVAPCTYCEEHLCDECVYDHMCEYDPDKVEEDEYD